jgi:hypothetical protein
MKTIVVFRYWQRELIALFPELAADMNGYYCDSYQHVGQHGGADYAGIIRNSRPATKQEYKDLAHELRQRGYKLDIRQRSSRYIRDKRMRQGPKQAA